jgi:hypothetical protein
MISSELTRYLRFTGLILSLGAGLILMGYLPMHHGVESGGVAAMIAGCAIGAAASIIGGFPIVFATANTSPQIAATLGMLSMAARFLIALGLGVLAAYSNRFNTTPMLAWLAASYLTFLIPDTFYATRTLQRSTEGKDPA